MKSGREVFLRDAAVSRKDEPRHRGRPDAETILPGFDVRTAANSAAFFARKAGGKIDFLKLVKLMYLAERTYMENYDEPLFYDHFVSLKHGPIPSTTLELINGKTVHEDWSKFIGHRKGNDVECVSNAGLDHLSKAEEEVLEVVWKKFSEYNGKKLAEWTHKHCPEWQDPEGGSSTISHEVVFKNLGKKYASDLAKEVDNFRYAQAALAASE